MRRIIAVLSLLFVISLITVGQMHPYYSSVDFSQPAATVEANLKTLITNTHNALSYSATYNWLKYTDEDPSNTSNVILMYNGQSENKNNIISSNNTTYPQVWNREHTYPQSLINSPADSDLHHMRACDGVINGNRGDKMFATGSGSYASLSSSTWYPGDEWKGDVARMIMYVHLRYNEPWTDVGSLSLFLQWNVEDPVSAFEKQRNDRIYSAQGNRNPFIDQPYIATYLWGGTPAEDTWGWPNKVEVIDWTWLVVYPNPVSSTGTITFSGVSATLDEVAFYDLSGKMVYTLRQPVVNNKTLQVNTAILKTGVYLLKLRSNGSEVTKKLVVN
ncbi:MAG: endonuclease [Flavobacteriales bacterium]|nr:endonuclease [Flavobacteriales bacterium]MCB9196879.1 endonuclease [Flavobacteriales bacterium]